MRSRPAPRRRAASQRGAATLLVAVVLFLLATLMMLYVNRGAVAEQRMSANEVRAKEAFAQAVAGLDAALAYMRDSGGIDHDKNDVADPISGGRYRAAYCTTAAEPPACPTTISAPACGAPTNFTDVLVLACGWSDDNSSVQRVVQHLRGTNSTAGNASTPLISKSTTNLLTGGASIFNYHNDLTIWSGGPTIGQSNTGKTFIRDAFTSPQNVDPRNTGNSPACNTPPTGYTCSTQGSTIGHDVVTGDTALSAATGDQFFARFFGKPPAQYKATVPTMTVAPADVGTLTGAKDEVIWVTGDASLDGLIGTADKPVILIVEGALTLGSNTVINGLVYSMGAFSATGTPTVYGSLITASTATATGNLKIIYDPNVIGRVATIGRAAKVPGSFRDW